MDKTMQKFITEYDRAIARRHIARDAADTIIGLLTLAIGAVGLASIFIVLDVVVR